MTTQSPVLIIGVGHPFRSDDGVGPVVAERLRARGIETVEQSGEGAALIDCWKHAASVILIDATQSGAEPGTIREMDAGTTPLPAGLFRYSTHLFGVAEAIETARALNELPKDFLVYGIEGTTFDFGQGLSPAVAAAADEVMARILERLGVGEPRGRAK